MLTGSSRSLLSAKLLISRALSVPNLLSKEDLSCKQHDEVMKLGKHIQL